MSRQVLEIIYGPELDIKIEEGRAKGREEGRAEGEARGRAEGEARGRAEERENSFRSLITAFRKRSISQEQTANDLMELYGLSAEEAAAKVALYWNADFPKKADSPEEAETRKK